MAAAVTLALLVIFCGISEYFRLQIIAVGVRDALEDAIISVVNDNYAGVYHGVREGYSGSYQPFGEDAWEETLDTGDVYGQLDRILGTQLDGGRRFKYMGGWTDRRICAGWAGSYDTECTVCAIRPVGDTAF